MDDDAYALTPFEMATLLAYTYTGTTPDQALYDAAMEGLTSDEDVRAQIVRLLKTDKAREHLGGFVEQWLRTDEVTTASKDETLYPTFTQDVKEAMAQEAREILLDVLLNDNVPFERFYDSDYTFVNEVLAEFYGIAGVSGEHFRKVTAPERGGILTSGAFLSTWATGEESHLIKRAVRVRERAMCQHLPPFPSNIDLTAFRLQQENVVEQYRAANNGQITDAHLYFINTDIDACKSCHEYIINPLGVGLEDYDAVGLPRTQYNNGLDVDFTGYQPDKENHNPCCMALTIYLIPVKKSALTALKS